MKAVVGDNSSPSWGDNLCSLRPKPKNNDAVGVLYAAIGLSIQDSKHKIRDYDEKVAT
jgi:hypothetical protein